jgi:hypothetical protein
MSNTFVPFTHQPESVLRKESADAAYEIPANYYARVVINALVNASASVNGITVYVSPQLINTTQSVSGGSPSSSTPPANFFGTCHTSVAPTTANPGLTTTQNWVSSGRTWSHPAAGDTFTIFYHGTCPASGHPEFWLTAGDELDLTGADIYAHIELYPIPS